MLTEIYRSTLFHEPHAVCVEADDDVILDLTLDVVDGEHFDWIRDVLAIDFQPDGWVRFETCRTLKRPGRGVLLVPRSAIASIYAKEERLV